MNRNDPPAMKPLVIFQIGNLYGKIHRECDRLFREKAFPLEMDQIPVVLKLYFWGKASQQELATRLRRDKASINRTVSFLVKKDIVKVIPDAADKRKTLVELTGAGKKLAMKANGILEEFDATLSSVLSATERKQFHEIMSRLIGPST